MKGNPKHALIRNIAIAFAAIKGYSFEDLQQVCSEAQIPSHIIRQALKNVEEKRSRDRTKRQQEQEYINQLARRGLSIGIAVKAENNRFQQASV